jgi:hypothetical protein
MTLRSLRVRASKDGSTLFVVLPPEACEPVEGGCSCDYCKAHPDRTPMWDTLAVASDPRDKPYTWLVHNPRVV